MFIFKTDQCFFQNLGNVSGGYWYKIQYKILSQVYARYWRYFEFFWHRTSLEILLTCSTFSFMLSALYPRSTTLADSSSNAVIAALMQYIVAALMLVWMEYFPLSKLDIQTCCVNSYGDQSLWGKQCFEYFDLCLYKPLCSKMKLFLLK